MTTSQTSQRLGPYEVKGILGKGTHVTVFRGFDGKRTVALKCVHLEHVQRPAIERLRKAAPALAALRHPAIVGFVELIETHTIMAAVSELAPGDPLASTRIKHGVAFDFKAAWDIARQVLDALTVAHARGIFHGNLKPSNIFVDPEGNVRVADFAGDLVEGEPFHLAPEQITGAAPNARIDLYQVGVLVYQLVTGRQPFSGSREEVAHRVLQERPSDPSTYDPKIAWQLDWVIQRALSKDPSDRFGSARELLDGLRLGLQDSLGSPLPVPPPPKPATSVEPPPKAATPGPVLRSAAPPPEAKVAAPQPSAKPAAPPPQPKVAAPQPSAKAAAPLPEPKVAAPQPIAKAAAPLPEPKVAAPQPSAKPAVPPPEPKVAAPQQAAEVVAPQPAAKPAAAAPAPKPAAPAQSDAAARALATQQILQKAKLASAAPRESAPAEPSVRVLFVDDDERVLNALRSLFRPLYEVFTAGSGAEALAMVKAHAIQIVITDQRMPGMTGVELLREVRKVAPHAVRMLLTGYSDLAAMVGSINDGEVFRFVKKPWDNDEIRACVAEAAELAATLAKAAAAKPLNPRNASLLVIESGEGLSKGLERLIAGSARVHRAATPRDAAKLLQTEEIAAVIADLAAGKDGLVSLFKLLKAKRPETLSILVADDPDSEIVTALINDAHIYRFMPKPVNGRQLRSYVSEALRRYAALHAARVQAKEQHTVQDAGGNAARLVSRTA